MSDWQDRLGSYRLRADQEFEERVRDASLSRRQWDLAMTAVDFRFADAADPDAARLVADTSKVDHAPAEVRAAGEDAGGADGGALDRLRGALGLGGDDDDPLVQETERLAREYADRLEAVLERENAWEDLRRAAAES
jgi:formylglycine-generating enzyme required for sulfatase activity